MRFLLATYGSRGDVDPMVALGRALMRDGHAVVLAGPPEYAVDAAAAGIDYRAMGGSMDAFLARNSATAHAGIFGIARAIKREVDAEIAKQFELLVELLRGADRLVAASLVFAARSCAEHAGKPYHFVALAPETFPSRHHPGLVLREQSYPKWVNRISWWVTRRIDNWLLRRPINRGRARLGLPSIGDALAHFADPAMSLLATDAELAPAPPDVAVAFPACGAMLLEDAAPLPPAVEAFLEAGERPVYIAFGSMPDANPDKTRALIAEAVRRARCRAIVYTRHDAAAPDDLGADILWVGRLPHGRLFPRVAVAVHHGGAGTSSRAARAGVPQVLVPHLLDQFPWAARLARRGIATTAREPAREPTSEPLAQDESRGRASRRCTAEWCPRRTR